MRSSEFHSTVGWMEAHIMNCINQGVHKVHLVWLESCIVYCRWWVSKNGEKPLSATRTMQYLSMTFCFWRRLWAPSIWNQFVYLIPYLTRKKKNMRQKLGIYRWPTRNFLSHLVNPQWQRKEAKWTKTNHLSISKTHRIFTFTSICCEPTNTKYLFGFKWCHSHVKPTVPCQIHH